MSVIALVNQKGGCAKSTTAVHLAYWLFHKQRSVLLIDADAQRSSSIWLEALEDPIPYVVAQTSEAFTEQLSKSAGQYDMIVVDGPAGLSDVTKTVIYSADLAVIPCQPTGVDLRSAADAIRLIRQAQAERQGLPRTAIFLSRAVKGTRLKDEAIEQLESLNVPVLQTAVHQRQAIADTFGQASTVWELLGKAAVEAAEELEQLFREMMALLPRE